MIRPCIDQPCLAFLPKASEAGVEIDAFMHACHFLHSLASYVGTLFLARARSDARSVLDITPMGGSSMAKYGPREGGGMRKKDAEKDNHG